MPNPTYSELRDMHHAAETARLDLAAQLQTTQAALWRAHTLIRLPHMRPVIDFIKGSTEDEYATNADELDTAIREHRAQHHA